MEKRKKKINWIDITRADVIKAIEIFFVENPEYLFPKRCNHRIIHNLYTRAI